MRSVTMHQAKTNLAALLAQVESRRTGFVICRNGRPLADLVPHRRKSRHKPHPQMRKVGIDYDPTEGLTREELPRED